MKVASWVESLVGTHKIKDSRIELLDSVCKPKKATYPQIEFVSREEYLASSACVISEDKILDIIVDDLDFIEKRLSRDASGKELEVLNKAKAVLEKENFLSEAEFSQEEKTVLENTSFISTRPVYRVKDQQLQDMDKLCKDLFYAAGYILFFTINEKEVRGWEIKKGMNVRKASGKIHRDLEKGFIKAEVVAWKDFQELGRMSEVKSRGLLRQENEGYIVNDGDIIQIKFNV